MRYVDFAQYCGWICVHCIEAFGTYAIEFYLDRGPDEFGEVKTDLCIRPAFRSALLIATEKYTAETVVPISYIMWYRLYTIYNFDINSLQH